MAEEQSAAAARALRSLEGDTSFLVELVQSLTTRTR
jgi:hypothetical protein